MANISVDLQRTASATLSLGTMTADSTRPRRLKVYDIIVGSEATPADAAILWKVQRCTVAGTSTAVVPAMLDAADVLTEYDAGENHTIEATYTTDMHLLHIPLNQRATFRWVAAPGGELVMPATAANGFGIQTDVLTTGTPVITATIHACEQ